MNDRLKSGFTLFELLVTLAVISLIVGGGFYTIARSTNDRALERAADMLHSMVRIARTQAITNGANSRLIINLDKADPDSYLRKVGVVVEDPLDDHWVAVDRGVILPEGVFVVPQGADVGFPASWPVAGRRSVYRKTNTSADDSAVYYFDYPLKDRFHEETTGKPAWLCIQFAPNGRLTSANWGGGGLVPLSNQLILAKGGWSGGKVVFRSELDFVGIAFKSNGSSHQTTETELVDDKE